MRQGALRPHAHGVVRTAFDRQGAGRSRIGGPLARVDGVDGPRGILDLAVDLVRLLSGRAVGAEQGAGALQFAGLAAAGEDERSQRKGRGGEGETVHRRISFQRATWARTCSGAVPP